jgi:hypothetical protein
MDELQQILAGMDIPAERLTDLGWLARNLPICNGEHPDLERALGLIRRLKARA